MEKGVRAIRQLSNFKPFIAGEAFSLADIVAYHCFSYPVTVAKQIYDWDIIAEIPGLQQSRDAVAARPHCQSVDAEWQAALAEFQNS